MRFTKVTLEYLGGILAGFGLAVITVSYLTRRVLINSQSQFPIELWIVGFTMIAIGSTIAYRAQRGQK